MRADPRPLQIYKHFKGNLYQVLTIAQHTETGEKLVIYRSLYGEGKVYARPIAMFLSEVDHKKYPTTSQKYRFEEVDADNLGNATTPDTAKTNEKEVNPEDRDGSVSAANAAAADDDNIAAVGDDNTSAAKAEAVGDDNISAANAETSATKNAILEQFLDARSYEEKLELFYGMRRDVDSQMLSNIAMSLDIELATETTAEQFDEILKILKTMEKYECNRLRG